MGALGVRLHALSVTAFGPFGGTVDVDFDDLGADGLFLLHGPTGAGKTSVLDAIAFALYGVLPGSRRESRRLLSDHAAPGVVPRVELDATLGGRRLTIVRQPEFLRPKRRGVGTTKQNAKATLTWHDGRGENLTRIDEIALEVERLLGMRVDQFFQVVLLPQGTSRGSCGRATKNGVRCSSSCSTPIGSATSRRGSRISVAPARSVSPGDRSPSTDWLPRWPPPPPWTSSRAPTWWSGVPIFWAVPESWPVGAQSICGQRAPNTPRLVRPLGSRTAAGRHANGGRGSSATHGAGGRRRRARAADR